MQILAVAGSIVHTCAVRSDGQLVSFGHNTHDGRCDAREDLGPVLPVSAGHMHADFGSRSSRSRHCSYLCSAVRCSARLLRTQHA